MSYLCLLLGAAACQSNAAVECRLNSDCPAPQRCDDGACVPECREDRDCRIGEICSQSVCIDRGPMTQLCISTAECDPGKVCNEGICEVIMLRGPDAGTADAGGVDASAPDAASPDGGGDGLPYGAVCARAADCSSGLCLGPQGAPSGRCTISCTSDPECFFPDTCMDVPGAGRFCTQGSGAPTGAPCPGGPNDCSSGLCITLQDGSAICTQECAPLPGCPAGLACAPVPDGMGGAIALCAPGTGLGFGEVCASGTQCASGICVGVPGQQGQCSALCNQVPCPGGYTCTQVDDGAGGQVPICGPAGASGGGFGDPCAGASGCANGLCLHDARSGQAFCTVPCSSPAECAAVPGLACVPLQPGVSVCGPP